MTDQQGKDSVTGPATGPDEEMVTVVALTTRRPALTLLTGEDYEEFAARLRALGGLPPG